VGPPVLAAMGKGEEKGQKWPCRVSDHLQRGGVCRCVRAFTVFLVVPAGSQAHGKPPASGVLRTSDDEKGEFYWPNFVPSASGTIRFGLRASRGEVKIPSFYSWCLRAGRRPA